MLVAPKIFPDQPFDPVSCNSITNFAAHRNAQPPLIPCNFLADHDEMGTVNFFADA